MASRVTIIRAPRSAEQPYFACRRATAQDSRLSWAARGMLWYLLSKPDDWRILPSDLEQQCGRDKVYRLLRELEDAGYLKQDQPRGDRGQFSRTEYRVYESPQHETPFPEKPDTVEPGAAESHDNPPRPENPYTAKPRTGQPHAAKPAHTYKEILTDQQNQTEDEIRQTSPSATTQVPILRGDPAAGKADDDDPPESQVPIQQLKKPLPNSEGAQVLDAELQSLGLPVPMREQITREGAERGLALVLHAKGEGRNPAGLLVSMLRQGADPAPKYLELAQMKLQPVVPTAAAPVRRPAPRSEPVGLDERPGRGLLNVRGLWHVVMGQLELQLNRATFDTWLKGATLDRFEDGVLWVRPKHLYAREWLEKHVQRLLDESLSRQAETPIHVRFVGEAAAAAAGR